VDSITGGDLLMTQSAATGHGITSAAVVTTPQCLHAKTPTSAAVSARAHRCAPRGPQMVQFAHCPSCGIGRLHVCTVFTQRNAALPSAFCQNPQTLQQR